MTNREKFLEFLVQLSFGVLLCFVLLLAMGLEKEQLVELVTTGTLKPATEQGISEKSPEKQAPAEENDGVEQKEAFKGVDDGDDLPVSSDGAIEKTTAGDNVKVPEDEGDFSELFE